MPSGKTLNLHEYTVWTGNKTRKGSARQILAAIQADANEDSAIKKLKLEEYSRVLIDDAAYFVPAGALKFLSKQSYPSEFDKALQYLAAMPSSGLRILAFEQGGDRD